MRDICVVLSREMYKEQRKRIFPIGWRKVNDISTVPGHPASIFAEEKGDNRIVAFRGTADPYNFITDFHIAYNPNEIKKTALSFKNEIEREIPLDSKNLYFTGHSMGAVFAEIMAYYFHNSRAITFESPGSLTLVKHIHRAGIDLGLEHVAEAARLAELKDRTTIFLTAPNLVNTTNPQSGQLQRVYVKHKDYHRYRFAINCVVFSAHRLSVLYFLIPPLFINFSSESVAETITILIGYQGLMQMLLRNIYQPKNATGVFKMILQGIRHFFVNKPIDWLIPENGGARETLKENLKKIVGTLVNLIFFVGVPLFVFFSLRNQISETYSTLNNLEKEYNLLSRKCQSAMLEAEAAKPRLGYVQLLANQWLGWFSKEIEHAESLSKTALDVCNSVFQQESFLKDIKEYIQILINRSETLKQGIIFFLIEFFYYLGTDIFFLRLGKNWTLNQHSIDNIARQLNEWRDRRDQDKFCTEIMNWPAHVKTIDKTLFNIRDKFDLYAWFNFVPPDDYGIFPLILMGNVNDIFERHIENIAPHYENGRLLRYEAKHSFHIGNHRGEEFVYKNAYQLRFYQQFSLALTEACQSPRHFVQAVGVSVTNSVGNAYQKIGLFANHVVAHIPLQNLNPLRCCRRMRPE